MMVDPKEFRGVYPIAPTPFTNAGQLDEKSQRRLIDYLVSVGVQGVAILGFMGEAHKLSGKERRQVIQIVSEQSSGRLQVFVGVRALGTAGAIEQALEAKDNGADAVFVAPIGIQNDAALFNFYRMMAERSGIPVMLHDFPESFQTRLSPELISRLINEVVGIVGVKLEDPPVLPKLSRILELSPQAAIFGGLGGEYYIEELQRGAKGVMTGFAFPEVLLEIYEKFTGGNRAEAIRIFDKYCPLIRYEFQPKIGLAFRKHVYKKRGIFKSDYIRPPNTRVDADSLQEIEDIIERVGLCFDRYTTVQ